MPWKRDEADNEAEECEDRQKRVCRVGVHDGDKAECERAQMRDCETFSILMSLRNG